MKNHLFLSLIISSVFLFNCKSNDDNDVTEETPDKKLLLSKTTTIYYDNPNNPETTVGILSYNDNGQLISSDSDGRAASFEYDTSGKPTKINYYKTDKTLDYYNLYTYNGEQLMNIKAVYTNPNFNRTISYNYDSNGKLTGSTMCQSADCTNPYISTYTYSGDNISSESTVSGGITGYNYKSEYSYDDKLNPFININKDIKIMMGGAYTMSKTIIHHQKIIIKTAMATGFKMEILLTRSSITIPTCLPK